MQSWSYAILSQRFQVTLHRKYSGNVVWTTSGHFLYICIYQVLHVKKYKVILSLQGHSEGTSSVAFEVLIIICQIYFINLFIFNCLKLNTKLFIFKLFDVKFLFSENHVFRKQKRTTLYGLMDARPKFRILKLTRKNDDLLSLRHK